MILNWICLTIAPCARPASPLGGPAARCVPSESLHQHILVGPPVNELVGPGPDVGLQLVGRDIGLFRRQDDHRRNDWLARLARNAPNGLLSFDLQRSACRSSRAAMTAPVVRRPGDTLRHRAIDAMTSSAVISLPVVELDALAQVECVRETVGGDVYVSTSTGMISFLASNAKVVPRCAARGR